MCVNDGDCKKGEKCINKKCKPIQSGGVKYFKCKTCNQKNCNHQHGGEKKMLSKELNQWEHKDAKDFFDKIYEKYGFPYYAINKKGGICVWKNHVIPEGDIHYKLVLKDEMIEHSMPTKHYDFFYSHVKMYIPPEKLDEIQRISGSIGYDPLKKEVFARCGSFDANYATLRTIFDILNDKQTDYVINIRNAYKQSDKNLNYLKKELKKNNEIYKHEMELPCSKLAFPNKCK
tara:strand:- start:1317 stop:2009 length:693 start_codon:yes stop_codon:yes gene_type:complete